MLLCSHFLQLAMISDNCLLNENSPGLCSFSCRNCQVFVPFTIPP